MSLCMSLQLPDIESNFKTRNKRSRAAHGVQLPSLLRKGTLAFSAQSKDAVHLNSCYFLFLTTSSSSLKRQRGSFSQQQHLQSPESPENIFLNAPGSIFVNLSLCTLAHGQLAALRAPVKERLKCQSQLFGSFIHHLLVGTPALLQLFRRCCQLFHCEDKKDTELITAPKHLSGQTQNIRNIPLFV